MVVPNVAIAAAADSGSVRAQPCRDHPCGHNLGIPAPQTQPSRSGYASIYPIGVSQLAGVQTSFADLNPHSRRTSRPAASFNPA
jgi:hypothetical protein